MTLLETLGLDLTGFDISDPSLFEGNGTTTLRLGKRVPYTVSLPSKVNGEVVHTPYPGFVTLNSAKLTRLSLLKQQQVSTGNEYYLVTGILKDVKLDLEIVVKDQTVNLIDLLHEIANAASSGTMSRDEFLVAARRIGFNFTDGMPLFFQQFGASYEGFAAAVNAFKAGGATDVVGNIDENKRGRIQEAYASADGVPVTTFELGTVDRSMTPRKQGFLNLLDAQIDQFSRIVGMRKASRALTEAAAAEQDQDKQKALKAEAQVQNQMSRQWVSSWSGAQRRIENQNGVMVTKDQFDPVNAPCGRFTLLVNGNEVSCDLWRNSARANNGSTTTAAPAASNIGSDDPFSF